VKPTPLRWSTGLRSTSATPAAMPPELQAAADELDASARQLRAALREQPEATYLLDRLRHTYEQRLRLTRRGVMG
jgi:hypothetical protein